MPFLQRRWFYTYIYNDASNEIEKFTSLIDHIAIILKPTHVVNTRPLTYVIKKTRIWRIPNAFDALKRKRILEEKL